MFKSYIKKYYLKHAAIYTVDQCVPVIREESGIFNPSYGEYCQGLEVFILKTGMLYYRCNYQGYTYVSTDKEFTIKYPRLVGDWKYKLYPEEYEDMEVETIEYKPWRFFIPKILTKTRKTVIVKKAGYYKVKDDKSYKQGCFTSWKLELLEERE